MRSSVLKAALVVLALSVGSVARAHDHPPQCPCLFHRLHREGTPPAGKPRCIPHTDERAGFPRALAGHLQESATPGGIGYYVGGGVCLGHGHPRSRDEGTWGWDETGCHILGHRNILGWSHGRKYQGGSGAYRTDGHVVPDVIFATTSTLNSLGRREEGANHE